MADLRTSFPMLEDAVTAAGLALHKVLEGDAAAAKNALAGLIARNGAALAYLKVDPTTGALIVTSEGSKICRTKRGTATGSTAFVDVAVYTLANSKSYEDLNWVVSCFRDAVYEIVYVEDVGGTPIEMILADILVGSGDFTDSGALKCATFTTPGAGVNELRIRAKNQSSLSDFRGSVSIEEIQ